jgi:hypothetical protein
MIPSRSCAARHVEALEFRLLLSANVLTHHEDNQRTGADVNETVLTPADVNSSQFGKLFSYPVDGRLYAQPLYVQSLAIPGQGTHDVVFAATEHDTVYAFDADSNAGANGGLLWHTSFLNAAAMVTTIPTGDAISSGISPEIGITGTPVIDTTTNTLYVVAATKESVGTTFVYRQRLHALDITTGAEKFGGPVIIQASVPGTASDAVNGMVSFNPLKEAQRPALLLDHGMVYISWASHFDHAPYHGWVIAYDAATLRQVAAFNDTPNGSEGGIWMSGGGPSADAAGNVYVTTGNGTFDTSTPRLDWGDSFLKFTPTGGQLPVSDFFTPFNQANLSATDQDLGSSALLLLPDQPGPHPQEAIGGGKNGVLYVVDRTAMGGFNATTNHDVQEISLGKGVYSTPAYWNGTVYVHASGDVPRAYRVTNGMLSLAAAGSSTLTFGFPGASPVISANGTGNGIVWEVSLGSPDVLYALNATTLAMIYNSNQAGTRDQLDAGAEFPVPTVANGHVYVGTSTQLAVFGMLHAAVVNRRVFYNDSAFDGHNPAANAAADGAIATDKQALLPGGTATFANYTSYSKGINGIMIDVGGLRAAPTAADFSFAVGNDNNPAAWAVAPAPAGILLRAHAGVGGSDRIEITWGDGAIRNEWLQVTLKADAATGITTPDVFYFGNAVGESGNSTTDAIVNAADELAARNDLHSFLNPASITNADDFNRDGRVDATDEIIARNNSTTAATALQLIHPAAQATASSILDLLLKKRHRR